MDQKIESQNQILMQNLKEKEMRMNEKFNEELFKRREKAIDKRIIEEDHVANAYRNQLIEEAKMNEKVELYELKLKAIEEKKEEKRRQAMKAELIRKELEKEKQKVMASGISQKEMARKTPKQLQKLAQTLDIDIDALKEKAKKMRKGKNQKNESENKSVDENSDNNDNEEVVEDN